MSQFAVSIQQAIAHHQAGRLADAERGYRMVLAQQPGHADAIFRLGVICMQTHRLGEAEQLLRRGLVLQPNSPELLSTLSIVLANTARKPEAIALLRRAIALRPAPQMHNNLANMLIEIDQPEAAVIEYQRAVALQPNYVEALSRLGSLLGQLGRCAEAVEVHRRCVAAASTSSQAHCNLALALSSNGDTDAALAAARRAVELNPSLVDAWLCLGDAHSGKMQSSDAIEAYRKAIAIDSNSAAAHRGLGNALFNVDQLDEALAELREAIRLEPGYGDTHWDYALALLKSGRFVEAWPEFKWRHRKKIPNVPREIGKPRWNGEPLQGRRIFLQGEQAFGDRIHFIRFAKLVADAGGKVVVDTLPELRRLFESSPAIAQVIGETDPVPAVELCCPVMSLPLIFQITESSIPTEPYLFTDPGLSERWRQRLGPSHGKFRVGLVWAGRPKPDPHRSVPLAELAPIFALEHVQFVSLQTGPERAQLHTSPFVDRVIDCGSELKDFADTAALMSQLDLVITIDTAAAHLAGALGRPVWVMLKHHADYRWLLSRSDSPWYPTMTLYRQPRPGDWAGVAGRLKSDLLEESDGRSTANGG
jgi:tetratricopeptide (TPR) repeat protein